MKALERKYEEARTRAENARWWDRMHRQGAVCSGGAPTRREAEKELEVAEQLEYQAWEELQRGEG